MPVADPCDQVTVPAQPLAVSVKVKGVKTDRLVGGVILGELGFAFISRPVTAVLAADVTPATVQVAVIEYVPTAESVKLVPVAAPSDQVTVPEQPLAVSVKVDGEQTTKLPGGVMVRGGDISALRKTETVVEP